MNQKKAIVFFSAGLGDALLLIPMVKGLKAQGYRVAGLFNSDMPCAEMMRNTEVLDDIIDVKNKAQQAVLSLQKMKAYNLAVLNTFSGGRANFMTALAIAENVVTNAKHDTNNAKIKTISPLPGIHDAEQNLYLIGENNFKLEDLSIPSLTPLAGLPQEYTALQVSSGNAKIAYKNWPLEHWMEFLALLFSNYKEKKLVLLGNKEDLPLAEKLQNKFGSSILSLAGKTTITEVMQVLSHCKLFIGLDGGLMHLAAAFGKPTFTLWGPSNEKLYGYEQFDPQMHRCVRSKQNCSPCNSWIEPNTLKTDAPENCPDNACMRELGSKEVFEAFGKYLNSIPQDVR